MLIPKLAKFKPGNTEMAGNQIEQADSARPSDTAAGVLSSSLERPPPFLRDNVFAVSRGAQICCLQYLLLSWAAAGRHG